MCGAGLLFFLLPRATPLFAPPLKKKRGVYAFFEGRSCVCVCAHISLRWHQGREGRRRPTKDNPTGASELESAHTRAATK